MIKIKNLAMMTGVLLSLQACQSSDKQNQGTTTIPADTTLDTVSKSAVKDADPKLTETSFIEKAAVGGMMEVEMGNLTTQKSKSAEIIKFAKQMITDHTKANQELEALAKGMGLKLPGALPPAEQSHLAAMRQMQANEYDQNYMQMMVEDHAKTIDLFNGAARFEDGKIKDFAVKTLPVLQMHNKMAIEIDSLIKVKKPDNRGDDLPNVDKKHKD